MCHFMNFLVEQSTPAYSDEIKLALHSVLRISQHESFMMCSWASEPSGGYTSNHRQMIYSSKLFYRPKTLAQNEKHFTVQKVITTCFLVLFFWEECQNHIIITNLPKIIYLLIIKNSKIWF